MDMKALKMARPEGLLRTSMCSALRASFAVQICSRQICRTKSFKSRPPDAQIKKPPDGGLFIWRARKDSNLRPPSS
jgi:hypothetical protein